MAMKKLEKDQKFTVSLKPAEVDKLTIGAAKAGFENVQDYLMAEIKSKILEQKIGAATIERPTGSGRVTAPSNPDYVRKD